MLIVLTYSIFVLYAAVRIYLSHGYHAAQKKHSELYYQREYELDKIDSVGVLNNNQIDLDRFNREYFEMPISKQITIESDKCKKFYQTDIIIKRLGTIILSIMSLIGLWLDFQNELQLSSLVFAVLPSIVSLFNSLFEWFEIPFDVGFQQATPKKYQ